MIKYIKIACVTFLYLPSLFANASVCAPIDEACESLYANNDYQSEFKSQSAEIELTDSFNDLFIKLSKGNPGALRVLVEIEQQAEEIDPQALLGSLAYFLHLDSLGIYGSHIWMLYKDVCQQDLPSTLAVIRAWQMGIISREQIYYAIENRGKCLNLCGIKNALGDKLPQFKFTLEKDEL